MQYLIVRMSLSEMCSMRRCTLNNYKETSQELQDTEWPLDGGELRMTMKL